MKIYYIEITLKSGEPPTLEALRLLLGETVEVVSITELEPCVYCKGLEIHERGCPLSAGP